MPTEKNALVISIGRWQAIASLFITLATLAGTVIQTTKWAVRDLVREEVRAAVATSIAGYATAGEVQNAQQLGDLRLGAIERRLAGVEDRLEWLVRREVASDRSRGGDNRSGG